ncbi:MAG: hypothetical protein AAF608_05000 [Pseudomonadota bacterium]
MPASFFSDTPLDQDTSQYLEDVLAQVQSLLDQATAAVANSAQNEADTQALLDQATALIATIPASGTSPWKNSVRLATSSTIDIASPPSVFDGISAVIDDRILLTNQSVVAENGLWLYKGASVPLERPTDADTAAKRAPGIFTFVTEGSSNANTLFFGTGTTDNLSFQQFTAGGSSASVRDADFTGFLQGTLASGTTVLAFAPSQSITIPANFAGSSARAAGAPSGLIGLDVQVNAVSVGTLIVETTGAARFEATDPVNPIPVAAGQVISFISPDPVRDAANISFTIAANLDV